MIYTKDVYCIQTPKMHSPRVRKFLGLSDLDYSQRTLHYYNHVLWPFYHTLFQEVRNHNFDAILIAGDLISEVYDQKSAREILEQLREDLVNLSDRFWAPVCISYGESDQKFNHQVQRDSKKRKMDLMNQLHHPGDGIFVLDNCQKSFDEFTVTGYYPDLRVNPNDAQAIAQDFFQKEFWFDDDSLQILLCHNPHLLTNVSVMQELLGLSSKITLLFGGHQKDGYIPLEIQSFLGSFLRDYGLSGHLCRGGFVVSENQVSYVPSNTNDISSIDLRMNEFASIVSRGLAKYSWYVPSSPSYTIMEVSRKNLTYKRDLDA